ncbi:hypothetical protein QFZ75_007886 [Streptomyces sp. V3I8]|uniref:DUF7178 family protein n=1 Tax=Streptomyces sp. V3I8 TaxID=3042279 RepID=UPI002788E2B9|nr:hypothetical protein [Streptomyces sp. V3I8]MDQ1041384.1 hypothetical protein [Streptomyces sp. V3I8]
MLKFATAQIIAASLGDQQRVTKAAHRAVFQYDARPGYLYVRSRAISSRCNDNWDEFPADEIAASYRTFVGKPVFVNHKNDNHRRSRGVIIDAALHEDKNPDGSADTWAEVLMEIDAKNFPKLAKAILKGEIDRTSMGCDVERSVCSACGNVATTPAEYCAHIPGLKGKRIFRHTASGQRVGELVRETCYGLSFFENSVLVEPPADPTAHFLGVDSSGLGKAASKAAAIDFSEFDHEDDLKEEPDEEENKAHTPTPASQPAQHPAPAAPRVPNEGTAHDTQRRRDVVTQSKPFEPLKPSLNTLQAEAGSYRVDHEAPTAETGHPLHEVSEHAPDDHVSIYRAVPQHISEINQGDWVSTHGNWTQERADSSKGWHVLHARVPARHVHVDRTSKDTDEAGYQGPSLRGPGVGRSTHGGEWDQGRLFEGSRKTAAGPQFENPADHPWFKQAKLSHEHVLNHWNQATDEEKKQGARWYSDAHHVARSIAKLNPDITDDKEAAHKGAGVLSAYSPQQNWWANQHNAARSFVDKKAVGKGEGLMVMSSHANAAQRIMDGEDHQKVLKGPKTADFAHLIEHAGNKPQGDEDAAAGKPREHSDKVVVDRHALSVAAGRRLSADDSKGFPSGNRHYYEHAASHFRTAAAVISDREGRKVAPHEVQATTWLTRQRLNASEDENSPGGKGRQTVQRNQREQWRGLAGEHTPHLQDEGNSHVATVIDATCIDHDGTIRAEAYGEVKAPQDVDTLREENCPVCGDKDTYDGQSCQICGFISPPAQFRDPDLDMAKRLDLRKQVVDPSLVDNNGELQRVDEGGDAMPQDGQDPNAPVDPNDPTAQGDPNDPNSQLMDPDQLDENGLPPSPYGDQALDGTQQGPAVSDRNGDGMIQPHEIDMDGNANVQQDVVDPGQGGQAGPRELPGWGKDRTGDSFTPGPDMPYRPDDPSNPNDTLGQDDDDRDQMGMPTSPMMGRPGDGIADLMCGSCGFAADATPPQSQNMGDPMASTDGVVDGDVCPSCQRGQLLTPGEVNSTYSQAPAVERPAYS